MSSSEKKGNKIKVKKRNSTFPPGDRIPGSGTGAQQSNHFTILHTQLLHVTFYYFRVGTH